MSDLGQKLIRFAAWATRGCILVDGIIGDVNKINFTCSVKVSDVKYANVPLKILKGSQASFIEIPKDGTNCLMQFRDRNVGRPQLYSVHDVDEILINAPSVIFNDGKNGGMVLVKELQEQSNKDKSIIDAFMLIINGSPIPEPGNGSPSALQTALKTALTGKQSGTWNNLENKSITQ